MKIFGVVLRQRGDLVQLALEKSCSRCGEVKALARFASHPQTRDGLQSMCRRCSATPRASAIYACCICAAPIEYDGSLGGAPRKTCSDECRATWARALRRRRYQRRPDKRNDRLQQQEHTCVVCGSAFTPRKRLIVVDPVCSPGCKARRQILRKYGLSQGTYLELLTAQGGVCGICAQPIPDKPAVDHCHATGAIRGILHRSCTGALGMLGDSDEGLWRGQVYLARHTLDLRERCLV